MPTLVNRGFEQSVPADQSSPDNIAPWTAGSNTASGTDLLATFDAAGAAEGVRYL